MIDVNKAIAISVRTGKVLFGGESAVKTARMGKAKLIIISADCPQALRNDIEYYGKLSKIPVLVYPGTSIDLGIACVKPFSILALTIRDPGDSDILRFEEVLNV